MTASEIRTEALLSAKGIEKTYPGTRALVDVDLSVQGGEVHALLGENGAGKSTLMKVIAGSVAPDSGQVELAGDSVTLGSAEAARSSGIGIVYQELSLVPQLSVAENVLLGQPPTGFGGMVDWSRMRREAERHLGRVGFSGDPDASVSTFGMAERQLVEIAKAISNDARVLLMDEPTSALSGRETERLFEIIADLKASGVAIIYVSHRLTEILRLADRVTVLRDGRRVETAEISRATEDSLARMMLGRDPSAEYREDTREPGPEEGTPADNSEHEGSTVPAAETPTALRARGLARPPRLKPVDLELRVGEIVTVFGLVGAGRTRLARTLFGLEPATEGRMEILGKEVAVGSPVDAIGAGMGYVGEDRGAGLVPQMSVASNITLASFSQIGPGPAIDFGRERRLAQQYVDDLSIRTPSLDHPVATLSGGNQQKVVLARWTCSNARVLVLDDPTRGIDVGAKEEVFGLVRLLAERGVAILYFTSELREARELGTRLLVMADGRIAQELSPEAAEAEIMAAAGSSNG